jgi:hypothetical protein
MKKSKEEKISVFTIKVAVAHLSADDRKLIVECQNYEQEIINRIWSQWLHESLSVGKDVDLRIFLELYRRWKDAGGTGDRPKPEFVAVEPDFQKRIVQVLHESHPCYNARCVNMTVQRTINCIKNNSSRVGRLKLWQAVLLGKERLCASEGPIAVPFDSQNGKLEWENGKIFLTVRIDRFEVNGKVNASSQPIRMELLTKRMSNRFKLLLSQVAQGIRKWKGSKLGYNVKQRQFFAYIVVELDHIQQKVVGGQTAKLVALQEGALWQLEIGEHVLTIGSGRSLAYLRERLHREKEVRERPTFKGNRRYGHSRKRFLRGNDRLVGLWQNKTKTWNGQVVAKIVKELSLADISVVDVVKPTAKSLLNTAGGEYGPLWPTFQFCEILGRKASEAGIATRFLDTKSDAKVVDGMGCMG